MRRRHFLSVAAAGLAGACTRRPPPAPAPLHVVRVGSQTRLPMSGLHLADELGYFEAAGIKIEYNHFARAQNLPILASGRLDVQFGGVSPSLQNAVLRGAHVRLVAGRERATPCSSVMTLYGRDEAFPNGLNDIKLLRGKRVAYSGPTSFPDFALDLMLRSVGMRLADVRLTRLEQMEGLTALVAGQVDAALSSDFERGLEFRTDHIVRGIGLAEVVPNHQHTFVTFGPGLLDGDPEIGARFLANYLRGNREFAAGKTPRYLAEVAKANNMDLEKAKKACRDIFTLDGSIDRTSLQRYVDWAARQKYCPPGLEAAQLIDTRFLDRIAADSQRGAS